MGENWIPISAVKSYRKITVCRQEKTLKIK
jgi:hypothetical protein